MVLSDEEKNKIIEEEKVRMKVRLKYEQKSSGIAGVLSSVCPGLGQIYNGQFGKATFIGMIIIISIVILSFGITFWVKGVPQREKAAQVKEEKEIEMTEEGVIIEEETPKEETEEVKTVEKKARLPYIMTIIGIVGLCYGWSYGVKDAIKTAKKLNEEALKDL